MREKVKKKIKKFSDMGYEPRQIKKLLEIDHNEVDIEEIKRVIKD